jgi:hypothetical protein
MQFMMLSVIYFKYEVRSRSTLLHAYKTTKKCIQFL